MITTEQAQVKTLRVEIKTLTVGAKQMTIAVFKQLPTRRILNAITLTQQGTPWGYVRREQEERIVWQDGNTLFQCSRPDPFCLYEQDKGATMGLEYQSATAAWHSYIAATMIEDPLANAFSLAMDQNVRHLCFSGNGRTLRAQDVANSVDIVRAFSTFMGNREFYGSRTEEWNKATLSKLELQFQAQWESADRKSPDEYLANAFACFDEARARVSTWNALCDDLKSLDQLFIAV